MTINTNFSTIEGQNSPTALRAMSVDDIELLDRALLKQMANSMTPDYKKIENQVNEVVNHMRKADLNNLEETDNDLVFQVSEELAFEWIELFLSDVNRIERFFSEKKDSLINEFINMQEKFRLKSHNYEDKRKLKRNAPG
jgi:hypothetical protein